MNFQRGREDGQEGLPVGGQSDGGLKYTDALAKSHWILFSCPPCILSQRKGRLNSEMDELIKG